MVYIGCTIIAVTSGKNVSDGIYLEVCQAVPETSRVSWKIYRQGHECRHARVRRWDLGYRSSESYVAIIYVGCGGWGALRDMASTFPNAELHGIDYSQDMVLLAKKVNMKLMKKGVIEINQGSVSSLPFSDNTFDVVTAFEAYYFGPDLHRVLQEIKRVLKPRGTLLLVNEVYENEKFQDRNRKWAVWADTLCFNATNANLRNRERMLCLESKLSETGEIQKQMSGEYFLDILSLELKFNLIGIIRLDN